MSRSSSSSSPRISVIVPTKGRPTLARTLFSLLPSLGHDDEVIIVGNAGVDWAAGWKHVFGRRFRRLEYGPAGYFGDPQRNYGMSQATGTHLWFLDDDDEATDDALHIMRDAAQNHPIFFRFEHPELGRIWKRPELAAGNLGSPCILAPNVPEKLGRFRAEPLTARTGDWTFIHETAELNGRHYAFADELVGVGHREPW